VKRKGRPISQCDECREQRKKRQIHQKCVCSGASSNTPTKKEIKKYLQAAAAAANNSNNSSSFTSITTSRHIMSIEALLL
jgi:hypothetical protein